MPLNRRTSYNFWIWVAQKFPKLVSAFTIPYGIVVKSRALFYKWGWLSQGHLPCPVISVGNLTVGGTGKTPIVIWLARLIQSKGLRTGVLSRGYGRKNGLQNLLISNGEKILVGPTEAGDEPFLIASQCPGVAVAVGSDRYRLGQWVLNQMRIECFILDDGFQHLGTYRDVNLLLIDALDESGLQELFPLGRLREPLTAARRATAFLLTRTHSVAEPQKVLNPVKVAIGKTIDPILTDFQIHELVHISSGCMKSIEWVIGKRVLIFSGVGNVQGFRKSISKLDVEIVEEMVFPDHFEYEESDCVTIRQKAQRVGAEVILTTEKDAVKLASYVKTQEEMWAVRLEVLIGTGKDRLVYMVDHVLTHGKLGLAK